MKWTRRSHGAWGFAVAIACAACGGRTLGVEDPSFDGGGSGGSGGGSVTDGASSTDRASDPGGSLADGGYPGACGMSPLTQVAYSTQEELNKLLIGRWQRCIEPQTPGEEVGVEFATDGRWYPLRREPSGAIVRVLGIDFGGTWAYGPPGTPDPISGQPSTRGFFKLRDVTTTPPTFGNDPRQMRILFSPVQGRYVPLQP
jgi:hypothetical protein